MTLLSRFRGRRNSIWVRSLISAMDRAKTRSRFKVRTATGKDLNATAKQRNVPMHAGYHPLGASIFLAR
jgi:hypothetical protein